MNFSDTHARLSKTRHCQRKKKTYHSRDPIEGTASQAIKDAIMKSVLSGLINKASGPSQVLELQEGLKCIMTQTFRGESQIMKGTEVYVQKLHENYIMISTLPDEDSSKWIYLPRFKIIEDILPSIQLVRIQFPLTPASCLNIHAVQGKTKIRVGVLLGDENCWAHGQLYTALGSVTDPKNLFIYIVRGF